MNAAPAYSHATNAFQWAPAPVFEFQFLANSLAVPGSVLKGGDLVRCRNAVNDHLRNPHPDSQRKAMQALVDSYRADYVARMAEGDWPSVTERFVGAKETRRAVGTTDSFLEVHVREFSKLGIIQWPRGQGPIEEGWRRHVLPAFEDLEVRARCSYSPWRLHPMSDLGSYADCRRKMGQWVRPLSLSPQWRLAHCRWMHPYESVLHDFVHFGGVVLCLASEGQLSRQIEFFDAADALLARRGLENLPCIGGFVSLREALLEGTLAPEGLGTYVAQKLIESLSEPPFLQVREDAIAIYGGLAVFLREKPRSWWALGTDWPGINRGLNAGIEGLERARYYYV